MLYGIEKGKMHKSKAIPINLNTNFLLRVKEPISSQTSYASDLNKINIIAINEAAIHAEKKVVNIATIVYLFEFP